MAHASHIHQSWNLPSCKGVAAHPELCTGLASPAWHLTFPISWVKYQHLVN